MKEELEQKLFTDYPEMFKNKDLPMTQTCMCWGIETGSGWYFLLNNMCRSLKRLGEKYDFTVVFDQVKSKYGTLRAYYHIEEGPSWTSRPKAWPLRCLGVVLKKVYFLITHKRMEFLTKRTEIMSYSKKPYKMWRDWVIKFRDIVYWLERPTQLYKGKPKMSTERTGWSTCGGDFSTPVSGNAEAMVDDYIHIADDMSAITCETCGMACAGPSSDGGWVSTLCENCVKKQAEAMEEVSKYYAKDRAIRAFEKIYVDGRYQTV